MAQLGKEERNAIVLRFFEKKTVLEVATALRLKESAAQKRVNRATEKLRRIFVKRGVTVSTSLLTAAVAGNAVQAAPAALASSIAAAALRKGALSASTMLVVKGTAKMMVWAKLKTATLLIAGLAAAGATSVYLRVISNAPPPEPVYQGGTLRQWIAPARDPRHLIRGLDDPTGCIEIDGFHLEPDHAGYPSGLTAVSTGEELQKAGVDFSSWFCGEVYTQLAG